MFWTNFISDSSVHLKHDDFEAGASLDVDRLALFDYFSVNNALADGNSIDATVSYSVRWAGDGTPLRIDDGTMFHFDGRQTTANIAWSAREAGFRFHSSPAHTTSTNFALIGRERNGVFYPVG